MKRILYIFFTVLSMGCSPERHGSTVAVIDPGHFHASLILKNALPGVDRNVKVYAPEGKELQSFADAIDAFNTRDVNPTSWSLDIQASDDYLNQLPVASDDKDIVVLAGNNQKKAQYILEAVKKGYNVLSDKPMAISSSDFDLLTEAYRTAKSKGVVIYELMTERYDVQNIIVKALASDRDIMGDIRSIDMESVHHFCKNVAGSVLHRPAWYYDVRQQGEGIADVTTHLIDQIFWICSPDKPVNEDAVTLVNAAHYPTVISLEQYALSTGERSFPDYLHDDVAGDSLFVYSNGSIAFLIGDVHASVSVRWDFQAPEGSGDTSSSVIEGSKSIVRILQDGSTSYVKSVFIDSDPETLLKAESRIKAIYPEISFVDCGGESMMIRVPDEILTSHEDHFNLVANRFLELITDDSMPHAEYHNTLAKYKLTISAIEIAKAVVNHY